MGARRMMAMGIFGRQLVPFTDGFGSLSSRWTGAGLAVGSGVATISPTAGAEQITNPGFEGTYTAGVAANWSKIRGTWTESADAQGGTKAQQINNPAGNTGVGSSNVFALTPGQWVFGSCYLKALLGTGLLALQENFGAFTNIVSIAATNPAAYTQSVLSAKVANTGNHKFNISTSSNASADVHSILFDTASVKVLTLATLMASVQSNKANVAASVKITRTPATQAGVIVNLDSALSPANFIVAYLDGAGSLKLDECVAGTYTNKISAAVTYVAGAALAIYRNGTACRVYYNGAQVGVEQTMSANTNMRHGLFSTYSGNTFDDFSLSTFTAFP
jgi:hypothetical protein